MTITKYTKLNTLEELPSGGWFCDNNGFVFYCVYRATLFGLLQRGYNNTNDDFGSLLRVVQTKAPF